MSAEQSYNVTLKINHSDGDITSARLLKSRSKLPDDILDKLNQLLSDSFDKPKDLTQTSVALGNIAEEVVLSHLRNIEKVNQDFYVYDTSSLTGCGDISVTTQNIKFCIEVKNYTKPVPSKELDKFHNSVNLPDYNAGIIIQVNDCGYARERLIKSPIDIRIMNGKPVAYLTATDNQLLYPIITVLISMIKSQSDCSDISILNAMIEKKTAQLLEIHNKAHEMKICIEAQKKSIARMELLLNETLAITLT